MSRSARPGGGRRWWTPLLALLIGLALLPATWQQPQAEEMIDLTLFFQGSVEGKIGPCG